MSLAAREALAVLPADGRQSATALAVCAGTRRLLAGHGFASIAELPLASGRRADLVALSSGGDIWIVEIKSSVADFRADLKWPTYRDYCDRLFFAVPAEFPAAILPEDTGLVIADGYGAALVRNAPEHRLAGARRKAVTLRFAQAAARRLHMLVDPKGSAGDWME